MRCASVIGLIYPAFYYFGGFQSRTLLLDNVKKDDSGLYRCVADNQVPPAAEYQVKILVSFQPETSAVRMDIGITPDRQLDAKLECRISGNLQVKYTGPSLSKHR